MSENKNEVDLAGTHYDALETDMTLFLGLKTFLVRGWSGSGAFDQAQATWTFAKTQEAWEEGRDNYFKQKKIMLDSLRSNIAKRDPALGAELTENDLFSIQQVGHVTLRKSNTEREHAVIIFDPVSAPARSVATIAFSDASGNNKQTVNLTEGGPVADGVSERQAVIDKLFMRGFENFWQGIEKHEHYPLVGDLIENFDIKLEDVRRYEALMNIRYALRNQDEFVTKDRYSRNNPTFVNFADQGDDHRRINNPYYKRQYRDVLFDARIEERYEEKGFGLKDEEFFGKMKLAGAVMNLVWGNLQPNNTFARMNHKYNVNDKQIKEVMDDLRKRVEKKLQDNGYSEFSTWTATSDWRILFPAFREVYAEDKSEGAQREYLDTIMEGLQKFFPTVTNAPLPDPDREKEPPRALQKPQAALQPRKPGAAPLKPSA